MKKIVPLLMTVALLLIACQQTVPQPTEEERPLLVMQQYANEAAFDMLYPETWAFDVLTEGLLVFGPQATVFGTESGPTFTVFREPPLSRPREVSDIMNHYLDNGPLQANFKLTSEVIDQEIDGRPAQMAFLEFEGDESADAVPLSVMVVATSSIDGAGYIFTATTLKEDWPLYNASFQVMVNSVKFNE